MHALITSFGAAGDVYPFLGLADGLRRLNHRVTLALEPAYAWAADALGARFVSLGEPEQPPEGRAARMMRSHAAAIAFIRHYVIARIPRTLAAIEPALRDERPDVVVCHHSAGLGVPWIARRAGIPFAMGAVAPASWTSIHQPTMYPGMPDRDTYASWAIRLGVAVGSRLMSAAIDPHVNRVRRSLGFGAGRRYLFDEMFTGVANLGFWSPLFRHAAPDDPTRSTITGFTSIDRPDAPEAPSEPSLTRFLASGDPPIIFTLGTSVPHALERFFDTAVSACRELGVRGVLLTGRPDVRLPSLPSSIIALEFAPLAPLLPRVCAVVHHGGLGTIAACLRAGAPMLCVPHLYDQFDNSRRARLLGLSRTLPGSQLNSGKLRAALQNILADEVVRRRAREIQAQIVQENPNDSAARALVAALHH